MKRALVLILVLAAVGLLVFFLLRPAPVSSEISVSGTIESTQVDCAFQISGKIEQLGVSEGDRVKQGQVIARLDRTQLEAAQRASQDALKSAQAQIAQMEAQIQLTSELNAAHVGQAQAALGGTQARYASIKSGPRAQEIQAARQVVAQARADFDNQTREYTRSQNLFGEGVIPAQKRDAAHTAYLVARSRYRQANEQLSLLEAGARSQDIDAAAQTVKEASANLQAAQASSGQSLVQQRQLAALRAQRDQAQNQLAQVQTQLGYSVLLAPISGTVLVKPREQGEVVSSGTVVVTLADLSSLYLEAFINEADLGRVRMGQWVDVTTDSHPGRKYRGSIYYISSQAEFTPRNLQTRDDRVKLVYRIKIRLPETKGELFPGMIADGVIVPQ